MRLTIDNLDGSGEHDYSALLDADAPPKIVRKLNQAPSFTGWLVGTMASVTAAAGSKLRLYQDSGGLWFSGYLSAAPVLEFAGEAAAGPVFRMELHAIGELAAMDRVALSERVAMGGLTVGQAVSALSAEANGGFCTSAVQDVSAAGCWTVESGERWSTVAAEIANGARAVLTAQNRALALSPVGTVSRTLSDGDTGFVPAALKLAVSAPRANDITVIGGIEPACYVRDCITSLGTATYYALSEEAYAAKATVLVEDDFHGGALDATKWVSDFTPPLAFAGGGAAVNGQVSLRYRDKVEVGGLLILEQTGISYTSGEAVFGALFNGGVGDSMGDCLAGIMVDNGAICPVVQGALMAPVAQMTPKMLYEFRTLVFHPEPARAGQVYASSVCNGASARSSEVWFGNTRVVLTMRVIDPNNPATLSAMQTVLYDGSCMNVQAFGDYCPVWGANVVATVGYARATNYGPVWAQSMLPGGTWRTRLIGDVTAGAECYLSAKEIHFTSATEPIAGEQLEVFYRSKQLACGRVADAASVLAMSNTEGSGERQLVLKVSSPAPRTSLDCEQAARALLDDLTRAGHSGEYQVWAGCLPQGATDVQPGEVWTITAAAWGVDCAMIVREVEIAFQNLSDGCALFTLRFADDAAAPFTVKFAEAKHNALGAVVAGAQGDNVADRPAGLPDARLSAWSAQTLTLDMGTAPIAGGGFELRVEGDWGWGTAMNQNLVGRYTSQSFTLPNPQRTQTYFLRQYDASSPVQYSPYSTMLNLIV